MTRQTTSGRMSHLLSECPHVVQMGNARGDTAALSDKLIPKAPVWSPFVQACGLLS